MIWIFFLFVDVSVSLMQAAFVFGSIWLYGWQGWNGWWVVLGIVLASITKAPSHIRTMMLMEAAKLPGERAAEGE